jgi:uncharacterized ferredoxin-like protein
MTVKFEEETRKKVLMDVAEKMMIAARTAPKARGIDNIKTAVIDGEDIMLLHDTMVDMVKSKLAPEFFLRDAENIKNSSAAVLIGTSIKPAGLTACGLCGHGNCAGKAKFEDTPCAFNTGDLGIAVGSAVSVAMDSRVDNRVMYSAGMAARRLKLLGEDIRIIYVIPLSCTGKNPFFDRKWPK